MTSTINAIICVFTRKLVIEGLQFSGYSDSGELGNSCRHVDSKNNNSRLNNGAGARMTCDRFFSRGGSPLGNLRPLSLCGERSRLQNLSLQPFPTFLTRARHSSRLIHLMLTHFFSLILFFSFFPLFVLFSHFFSRSFELTFSGDATKRVADPWDYGVKKNNNNNDDDNNWGREKDLKDYLGSV